MSADGRYAYVAYDSATFSDPLQTHEISGQFDLLVLDLSSEQVVETIPLPESASFLALSPDGSRVYALLTTPNHQWVAAVDTATNTVLQVSPIVLGPAQSPGFDFPNDMVISRDGLTLFVIGNDDEVATVDTSTLAVTRLINVSPPTTSVSLSGTLDAVVSANGRRLYVGDWELDEVLVMDTSTDAVIDRMHLRDGTPSELGYDEGTGWRPHELYLSPDGSTLYVNDTSVDHPGIETFNTATDRMIKDAEYIDAGSTLLLSPDGRTIYENDGGSGAVAYDAASDDAVAATTAGLSSFIVDRGPFAISPDGRRLYFADHTHGGLVVLDVDRAPAILTQPVSATITRATAHTLHATVTGNPEPTVRWRTRSSPTDAWSTVAGATTPSLTVSDATAGTAEQFQAVLTNAVGTTDSAVATLTVPAAASLTAADLPSTIVVHGPTVAVPVSVLETAQSASVTVAMLAGGRQLAACTLTGTGNHLTGTIALPGTALGIRGLTWAITTTSVPQADTPASTDRRPVALVAQTLVSQRLSRRGSLVTVRATVKQYTVGGHRFTPSVSRLAYIERRTPTGWIAVAKVRTDRLGHLRLILRRRSKLELRVWTPGATGAAPAQTISATV